MWKKAPTRHTAEDDQPGDRCSETPTIDYVATVSNNNMQYMVFSFFMSL